MSPRMVVSSAYSMRMVLFWVETQWCVYRVKSLGAETAALGCSCLWPAPVSWAAYLFSSPVLFQAVKSRIQLLVRVGTQGLLATQSACLGRWCWRQKYSLGKAPWRTSCCSPRVTVAQLSVWLWVGTIQVNQCVFCRTGMMVEGFNPGLAISWKCLYTLATLPRRPSGLWEGCCPILQTCFRTLRTCVCHLEDSVYRVKGALEGVCLVCQIWCRRCWGCLEEWHLRDLWMLWFSCSDIQVEAQRKTSYEWALFAAMMDFCSSYQALLYKPWE